MINRWHSIHPTTYLHRRSRHFSFFENLNDWNAILLSKHIFERATHDFPPIIEIVDCSIRIDFGIFNEWFVQLCFY